MFDSRRLPTYLTLCAECVYTPHSQEVVKAATLCNYITAVSL